jgi:KaiC/GvpD/RAD55 family RecA-like ATPase
MVEKSMMERSPIRIFERAIGGGLGEGKLGVVLSRHGVGKTGFLIGLAVDQLLQGKKVLYISTKESVEHINNFFDQIFHAMAASLDLDQIPQKQLRMERNRYIHVYNRDSFSLEKLEQSVAFLKDAAGFVPDMVILDGTPRFENTEEWEIQGVKKMAAEWGAEIWTSSNIHREGQESDGRGVPNSVARFDDEICVIVNLESESGHVKVKILKEHGSTEPAQVQIELDPKTLLLRWR